MTPEAFACYVEAHYPHLIGIAMRCGRQRPDAENVVQQAVVRLLAIRDAIDPQRVDGLFLVTVRRLAVSDWRAATRARPADLAALDVADRHAAAVPPVEADEAAATLRAVVARSRQHLNDRQRRAMAASWMARGDRQTAQRIFSANGHGYDGALNQARERLRRDLSPHHDLVATVGADAAWQIIHDVFAADLPTPADAPGANP